MQVADKYVENGRSSEEKEEAIVVEKETIEDQDTNQFVKNEIVTIKEDVEVIASEDRKVLDMDGETPVIDVKLPETKEEFDGKQDEIEKPCVSPTSPVKGISSMAIFIHSTLEVIDKSKAAKKNKLLKEACAKAADVMKEKSAESGTLNFPFLLEPVIQVLQMACEAKSADLTISCLDSMQKLIAYNCVGEEVQKEGQISMLDQLVDSICLSAAETDEKVHLQIVKVRSMFE